MKQLSSRIVFNWFQMLKISYINVTILIQNSCLCLTDSSYLCNTSDTDNIKQHYEMVQNKKKRSLLGVQYTKNQLDFVVTNFYSLL